MMIKLTNYLIFAERGVKMNNFEKTTLRVSVITIIVNIILSLFKAFAGIVAHSGAMISDAVHSASDVLSTLIVIAGAKASGKTSDKEHPYGHERMECIASILLAVILFITGFSVGYDALREIIRGTYKTASVPGMLALFAAVVSVAVKEWMFHYTKSAAKKIDSTALMADAWHHRSDSLSSVGALLGIGLSILGFPVADSVASIIICILILKVSIDIFCEASARMIDTSADLETVKKLKESVLSVDGVIEIDVLNTRLFGAKMYVDVEFSADANLTLLQAHTIAEAVHDKLENEFPRIKHCMVHVNPYVV